MVNQNNNSSQGEGCAQPPQGQSGNQQHQPPPPGPTDHTNFRGGNKVYKSGPLFLSSKGIGWTTWKKRWFILTRTSLVFFRSDPNVAPKGTEVNLTLGGIDLNSSGSVVLKEDKKHLTVLFPDGRDGRAFTLKTETLEDLHEWKAALEEALANAPSAALVMGQNGIFRNDQANVADVPLEQSNNRQPVKSLVIGRPILLALEDIDGTPSFLEKALRFIEEHGVLVEGILRQAADVEDVERRIREYEQGKSEFSPDEDPHIIADCIKYVLRELPSSPVPASCCNALLEAFRTERGMRVSAMRTAICETFPEPNRRLLQRILMMMQTVASNKAKNRMSTSAVAACMAPLLLRPLLAGDCELESNFDMGGDGSVQLLQAAAAANHAQAIVITLLEEYNNLLGEGTVTPELYSDSEDSSNETEELSDDESFEEEEDDDDDAAEESDADTDDDFVHPSSATTSEMGETEYINGSGGSKSDSKTVDIDFVTDEISEKLSTRPPQTSSSEHYGLGGIEDIPSQNHDYSGSQSKASAGALGVDPIEISSSQNSRAISNGPVSSVKKPTVWGRAPAKKNLPLESIDILPEDEVEIQKLEAAKIDLQNQITEETKSNALLQENLERRRNALNERRLALEKDVARLQEQLQKEKELRKALEAGLKLSPWPLSVSSSVDDMMKAKLEEVAQAEVDVTNLKQRADELGVQLSQQREYNSRKSKQDTEPSAAQHAPEKSRRSKHEAQQEKGNCDKDKKQEPQSSTSKNPSQGKQSDSGSSIDSSGTLSTSTQEPGPRRSTRKSGTKTEGSNSTTSAISKLTNQLNFLKQRRTQITNDLQNLDKARTSRQPVQNLEKSDGSQSQASEKGKEADSYQLPNNQDSRSIRDVDRGRSEVHPNLDREKSESFPTVEKGRNVPPRTFSR